MEVRKLEHSDMDAAAHVHRAAFDNRLPWLSGIHTPEEDLTFFRDHVFVHYEIWGAFEADQLVGIVAFRSGWITQLYILPAHQGRGIGSKLLSIPQASSDHLRLWTFQKNGQARSFYESKGFIVIEETDGAGNEEREPDVLYEWRACY